MKVIFLDFDGIVCHKQYQPNHIDGVIDQLDPTCVARIVTTCYLTNSKIAIHSTWAYVFSPEYIIQKLKDAGMDTDKYLHKDWLCTSSSHDKCAAIQTWLLAHPDVTNHVIIDDDMIEMNHQVLVVSGWTDGGFKDKHIKDVVKALNPAEPGIGYKIKCTSCGRPTFTDTGLCLKCESKAGRIERGEK